MLNPELFDLFWIRIPSEFWQTAPMKGGERLEKREENCCDQDLTSDKKVHDKEQKCLWMWLNSHLEQDLQVIWLHNEPCTPTMIAIKKSASSLMPISRSPFKNSWNFAAHCETFMNSLFVCDFECTPALHFVKQEH